VLQCITTLMNPLDDVVCCVSVGMQLTVEIRSSPCFAECCRVLQSVAVYCSLAATLTNPLDDVRCVEVCCSVLQCVAVCCSVLQCVALCCSLVAALASPLDVAR